MHARFPKLATAVVAGLAFCAPGLYADIAEVESEDGKVMSFEYEGDKLRINIPENQGYMVLRDDHLYMVTDNNGQLMVVDLNSAFNMFGSMAASATPDHVSSEFVSMDSTGRFETLAGMEGEVYRVRFIDQEGQEQESEVVLSDDERAIGFRDAIAQMAKTMASAMRGSGIDQEIETGEKLQAELESLDKGVLRYGQDMRVKSITETTVAEERFVLPAEPTDLGGMMRGMMGGAGSAGPAGGSTGADGSTDADGYIEQKAERQQNRVEQKTDNAVDQATDSAVDKALDKAFDKIFGG